MSFTDVTCTYYGRSVAGAVQDYFTGATLDTRERKPTTKQTSQNRRIIEKEEKRLAKLARKPKTINTTQLDEFDLPFRSSQ